MLVGRVSERRTVERLVAAATLGRSGVLVLTGEPGIGKTALLRHAAGLAAGMRVREVLGTEVERDLPFAGLSQVLSGSLDRIDRLPGPQADALGVALAIRSGPAVDRFAVGAATLGLLSRLAEDGPLAVVIDDAHLLDRPSAEAVVFAARRLVVDPVLLLVAVRSGMPTPFLDAGLATLDLAGLDLESSAQLLDSAGTAPLPARTVERLQRATGGNPLAMLVLADDADRLERAGPGSPLEVPARVADAFRARTDALPADTRTALLVAATSGGARQVVTRTCLALGVVAGDLVPAVEAGLVDIERDVVRFRHPLVRSAVYSSAPPSRRREVHAAVAAAMSEDPDRAAWHLAASTADTDAGAADAMEAVADRARDRAAYDVAATALERSARLTPEDDERTRRVVAAAETAWIAGQGARAVGLLDEVGDPQFDSLGVRAGRLRATIATRTGSLAEALATLITTAARAAERHPDDAIELLADAVDASFYRADTAAVRDALSGLLALLPRSGTTRSRVLGTLAVGMARTLLGEGGSEELRRAVSDLADGEALRGDPMRTARLVLGPLYLRETGAVRDVADRALATVRAGAVLGTLPYLLFHVARDHATTDRWEQAETEYQESVRLAEETGATTDRAMSLAGLSWLEARRGRREACLGHAELASRLCAEHDIVIGRVWVELALAELDLGTGRPDGALAHLEDVVAVLAGSGVHDVDLSPGPELTEALVRLGRVGQARTVADEYRARARGKGQPWAAARAERAVAIARPDEDADARYEAALALHAGTRDLFELARTRLAYGEHLRRRRRRAAARPVLRSALETFDLLGAEPWAQRAALELGATGEVARRRGASAVDALTPQERQIARLLAEGRTTREAAAALFLSPKTVEYHLRHTYIKLGIGSRDELGDVMSAHADGR